MSGTARVYLLSSGTKKTFSTNQKGEITLPENRHQHIMIDKRIELKTPASKKKIR
ncbi:hypothetical protein ADIARSV_2924 [Arcticibacter svalbardensis MN12-7]|uniref:Uncharacterized protein n=1 Tax=Arcticibacter svalbardensis MN12-7 TaxID=1150600 RepID=R9GQC8_9SPHI|nr:hypothetical protein [Arcticibacter svalbardensis]EOR93931.1 hypothetical protein ADIARSV_2924 [Arcticibacter svalbardensis MN12-7]